MAQEKVTRKGHMRNGVWVPEHETTVRKSAGSSGKKKPLAANSKKKHAADLANELAKGNKGRQVEEHEVTQCSSMIISNYKSTDGRPCKNAIISPATNCHAHGGAMETSLGGVTVAKAKAMAGRGELFEPGQEFWQNKERREAFLEGQVMEILAQNPKEFAKTLSENLDAYRAAGKTVGIGRLSPSNQMHILVDFWSQAREQGMSTEDALLEAMGRVRQPIMTEKKWADYGKKKAEDAQSTFALAFYNRKIVGKEEGETDEEYRARLRDMEAGGERTSVKGFTAQWEYPMDQIVDMTPEETEKHFADHPHRRPGNPDDLTKYEGMDAFHESVKPKEWAKPEQAISTLSDYAQMRGYNVRFEDDRTKMPADGYWKADTSEIVVWSGAGNGESAAVLHVFAHELGHAEMNHGTSDGVEKESRDKEVAAETYALMVTSHFGVDASEAANHYVNGWRGQHDVDFSAGSMAAVRSAVSKADTLFTNLDEQDKAAAPSAATEGQQLAS